MVLRDVFLIRVIRGIAAPPLATAVPRSIHDTPRELRPPEFADQKGNKINTPNCLSGEKVVIPDSGSQAAARFTLTGRVQGIGMRPAVARFAQQLSLAGFVQNTCTGLVIHVEGPQVQVEKFANELGSKLPAAARITSQDKAAVDLLGWDAFLVGPTVELRELGESDDDVRGGRTVSAAQVPPDVVTCGPCREEVRDPTASRYRYPFASCADCGPRYSIIDQMPYERQQAGMQAFPLCADCRREFDSPADRHFHAQSISCPNCGPQLWVQDARDRLLAGGAESLRSTVASLNSGHIVALRGIGGYQLLVDATCPDAVARLRTRKRRAAKPLAVMVGSLAAAATIALLDDAERTLLTSPGGPIVVVRVRDGAGLATAVTADFQTVGLMLPTTPLHSLIFEAVGRPLVCTSGNSEGEPLAFRGGEAISQLRGIADVWLEHDRPIARPIDDSVMRVTPGGLTTIRLGRGAAPLPLELPRQTPWLAAGGHQKSALALTNGAQAVLGPHCGDLDSLPACERFSEHADDIARLYGCVAGRLACDAHPDYFSTRWAERRSESVLHVQHHHAHIAATMLEHGLLDRQVLGVAFDGTGYGLDGTVWGGEFLLATATEFERIGHLRSFALVGGERASREPWRVATALVRDAANDDAAAQLRFDTANPSALVQVLQRPGLSARTTSAGRLFDGIAALVLGIEHCGFEGQAAMLLEEACSLEASGHYEFSISRRGVRQLDWRPVVRSVLRDRAAGVSPGTMAMRFHRGVANAIHDVCRCFPSLPVVVGGGVFQNGLLTKLLADALARANQPCAIPRAIPANDGGLAAGQLAVAVATALQTETNSCV